MSCPAVPLRHLLELHDAGVWGAEDRANGISVLRSTNFNPDGSIRFDNLSFRGVPPHKRISKRLLPNDIVLEKSGGGPKQPVGRVCLYRGHHSEHVFGNFTARLRADDSLVYPEYLFWFLRHLHISGGTEQYQKHTSGIRNLDTKRYLEHPIPVPPLDEQRRIVDILNRAARIEALRRRAAERLREFVPALFVKMFGDRDQGFPCMPLREVAAIVSGATKGRKIDPVDAVEVPYLRVANVQDGFLRLVEIKTMTIRRGEEQQYALAPGDLVMTEGGDPDKLGRAAVWSGEIAYCAHQNHVFRVRPRVEVVLTDYLRDVAGSEYGKAYFLSIAKRTTGIASINKTQLGGFPVPVPPLDLQRRYAETVEAARAVARVGESGTKTSTFLTASLMYRLLENDVSERGTCRV